MKFYDFDDLKLNLPQLFEILQNFQNFKYWRLMLMYISFDIIERHPNVMRIM
jgi:hypothetical protein